MRKDGRPTSVRLAARLDFPTGFGGNWDALTDNLRDLVRPSMLRLSASLGDSLFLLARSGAASFAEAWALVSLAPSQALGLDEAFPAFAPNLLKMDIEGAEPDALEGAAELIRRFQPGLAIAVYHQYRHLWEIPLLLQRWLPRHRYFLRAHAHNSFEVVLYAQPLPPT